MLQNLTVSIIAALAGATFDARSNMPRNVPKCAQAQGQEGFSLLVDSHCFN